MERRRDILWLRDKEFPGDVAARPDSFIVSLDLSSHPLDFGIFTHDDEPKISYLCSRDAT